MTLSEKEQFKKDWEIIRAELKNSKFDLSKILIVPDNEPNKIIKD